MNAWFSFQRWPLRDKCIALLLLAAVALCWIPALNVLADRYVDDGLKRSLVSFATARALHSGVAVLQGTELAVQPMGIGLTLTLGQVLAPISDLVAQFADWMLWASIAFGLQKLLLSMGGSYWVTGFVTVTVLLWIVLQGRQRAPGWLTRLLVILLFTRLVMPVTIIGSEWLFHQFMAQTYQENQLATENTVGELQKLEMGADKAADAATGGQPAAATGLWGRFMQWGKQAQQVASDAASGVQQLVTNPGDTVRAKLTQLQKQLNQQVERLITLMVVFILQTIVLPVALTWALLQLCKGLVTPRPRYQPVG